MALPATFAEDPIGRATWQSACGTTKRIEYVAIPSSWLPCIVQAAVGTRVHIARNSNNDRFRMRVDVQLPTFQTRETPPQLICKPSRTAFIQIEVQQARADEWNHVPPPYQGGESTRMRNCLQSIFTLSGRSSVHCREPNRNIHGSQIKSGKCCDKIQR